MNREKDIRINDVVNTFSKYQQNIATAETKVMQLKISAKHKGMSQVLMR
jgi:hypothetical protein